MGGRVLSSDSEISLLPPSLFYDEGRWLSWSLSTTVGGSTVDLCLSTECITTTRCGDLLKLLPTHLEEVHLVPNPYRFFLPFFLALRLGFRRFTGWKPLVACGLYCPRR